MNRSAYERLGRWVIKIIVSLPLCGIGIVIKAALIDRSVPNEEMWTIYLLLVLCVSVGVQGLFLTFVAEDVRDLRRPRPKEVTNSAEDPVYTQCGNVVVESVEQVSGEYHIYVHCRIQAMNLQGCPEGCPYYHVPKPSGAPLGAGAIIGGIIGATGGPGGAVGGAMIGAIIGGVLENQRVKPPLSRTIAGIEREQRTYRIFISR